VKIKFIGTGPGKTSLKRFHSSILVSNQKYNLLIDCGDGVSYALLVSQIKFNSIDGIILTHLHPDHFSGLGSLLVQMKMNSRKNDLDIFVGKNQVKFVKDYILNSNLLAERLNYKIVYHAFKDNFEVKIKGVLKILPRLNNHLSKLKSYSKYKSFSFDSFSFLIAEGKKNLVYTGDIGNEKDLYLFNDFKIDLFISEATHVSFKEILMAHNQLDTKKTILTHLADEKFEKFRKQIARQRVQLSKIELATDGFEIRL
jgi:ribonuclease BN (tRNA processing enzyme)